MYIDLRKTLAEIGECLPEKDAPTPKQLQRMYELTLRLQSQELAVIYDMEAFGSPAAVDQRTLAQPHCGGGNRNAIVTLRIDEPLPATKKLTEAVEEHWKAMIHAAISDAAAQEPLPYFEKAFVEIEIVTPRGSNNERVWDTSNSAIQVILNNLKGIFFRDDDMEHMGFSVVGRWCEKGVTLLRISDSGQISADQSRQVLDEKQVKS